MQRSLAITLLILLAAACGPDRDATPPNDPGLAPRTDATVDVDSQRLGAPARSLPERPAMKRDTIMVGGTAESTTLDLVRSPPGFVVPFSTYVPEGLTVEFDTATAVHRVTFRGGAVMDDGFMTVAIHPAGTTRLEVEDAVRELVVSRAPGIDESSAVSPPSWGAWAVDVSYPVSAGKRYAGSAVIAQYGPRFFQVVELYSAEFADDISPRLDAVLQHWRWDDTGRMLTSGSAGGR